MSSKALDDLINELAKDFVPTPKVDLPDPERERTKKFFFQRLQVPNDRGECPVCRKPMRIHLSTFVCDECGEEPNEAK